MEGDRATMGILVLLVIGSTVGSVSVVEKSSSGDITGVDKEAAVSSGLIFLETDPRNYTHFGRPAVQAGSVGGGFQYIRGSVPDIVVGPTIENTKTQIEGTPDSYARSVSATGFLIGQVTDADGRPLADVTIQVINLDTQLVAYDTVTGDTGEVGPNRTAYGYYYSIRVVDSNYVSYSTTRLLAEYQTERLSVVTTSASNYSPNSGYLVGTVTDGDGRPLAGATVQINNSDLGTIEAETTTDVNGKFGPVLTPSGYTYTVRLVNPDSKSYSSTRLLSENETEHLYVVTTAAEGNALEGGFLIGRVMDEFGRPLTGTTIQVVDRSSGAIVFNQTTDGDGEFGPTMSIPGRYSVRISDLNLTTFSASRHLDGNETEYLTVVGDWPSGQAPPMVRQPLPETIAEGETAVPFVTFTDPDSNNWTATISVGLTDSSPFELELNEREFAFSVNGIDDTTENVTIEVCDDSDVCDRTNQSVTVENVEPSVRVNVSDAVLSKPVRLRVQISDPGVNDSHSGEIAWGDGTVETVPVRDQEGTGPVTVNHTYTDPGTYTATVLVEDDDGGVGRKVVRILVAEPSPTPTPLPTPTVTPSSTPTSTATPTPTPKPTPTAPTDTADSTPEELTTATTTSSPTEVTISQPGFGVLISVLAILLAIALAVVRRQ